MNYFFSKENIMTSKTSKATTVTETRAVPAADLNKMLDQYFNLGETPWAGDYVLGGTEFVGDNERFIIIHADENISYFIDYPRNTFPVFEGDTVEVTLYED
jgi:hypothetical protein